MSDTPKIRTTVNIEVDNAMEAKEKVLEYRVRLLSAEIIRLKRICGETITMDDVMGTTGPKSFNIVRSKRYA